MEPLVESLYQLLQFFEGLIELIKHPYPFNHICDQSVLILFLNLIIQSGYNSRGSLIVCCYRHIAPQYPDAGHGQIEPLTLEYLDFFFIDEIGDIAGSGNDQK